MKKGGIGEGKKELEGYDGGSSSGYPAAAIGGVPESADGVFSGPQPSVISDFGQFF